MKLITLYLVRHGETQCNRRGVYYGWTDCSLNSTGIQQAEGLKEILGSKKITKIYTSPLLRAQETTKIIFGTNREIIVDERLKEMNFGAWENKSYTEIQRLDPGLWEKWSKDWKNTSPKNGENFYQLYSRVKRFLQEIIAVCQDEAFAIITHQGCLRIIFSILLGMEKDGYWHFYFDQGTYSQVEIDETGHCTVQKINAAR